jgi:hypothetical protein
MKAPFIIWLILLVLGGLVPSSLAGEFGTFEDVRRALRKEGFKTDLSEFDFAVPKEMQNRSAAVCTDGLINPQRLESFLEPVMNFWGRAFEA